MIPNSAIYHFASSTMLFVCSSTRAFIIAFECLGGQTECTLGITEWQTPQAAVKHLALKTLLFYMEIVPCTHVLVDSYRLV